MRETLALRASKYTPLSINVIHVSTSFKEKMCCECSSTCVCVCTHCTPTSEWTLSSIHIVDCDTTINTKKTQLFASSASAFLFFSIKQIQCSELHYFNVKTHSVHLYRLTGCESIFVYIISRFLPSKSHFHLLVMLCLIIVMYDWMYRLRNKKMLKPNSFIFSIFCILRNIGHIIS